MALGCYAQINHGSLGMVEPFSTTEYQMRVLQFGWLE